MDARETARGEPPRSEFHAIQAATDMSFNIFLIERHAMMPMESYELGVPFLIANTFDLFAEDLRLSEPTIVAEAARPRLLEEENEAVTLGNIPLDGTDGRSTLKTKRCTLAGVHTGMTS